MGILAHHEGLVGDLLGVLAQVVRVEIAVVPDSRVAAVAVVEGWASLVQFAYLVIHCLDVRADAALVAEAPENDAGVVEVALHERLGTVDVCPLERQVLAHHVVGIAVAVGLVVGLVHHVDAPAVAQLVDIFAVGVVRRAQEVDVGLLHQSDVLLVGSIVHVAASHGVVVVAVHAAQLHVLAVDLEHLADDLDLLHAEVVVEVLSPQVDAERIEVGLLGRPEPGLADVMRHENADGVAGEDLAYLVCHRLAVDGESQAEVLGCFPACVAHEDGSPDGSLRVVGIGNSRHPVVADMHQGPYPQLHAAEDARQTPHVLVFKIASVAPAVHLDGQFVAAFAQVFSHVELRRRHRVLAVAHPLAVHPDVEGRVDAAEVEDEILREHLLRHVEEPGV